MYLKSLSVAALMAFAIGVSNARADGPLQIYGATLDETVLDAPFCEAKPAKRPADCEKMSQALPEIVNILRVNHPTPYAILVMGDKFDPHGVQIWYLPRALGGQSYLISSTRQVPRDLDLTRDEVLKELGAPTIELTQADLKARGAHVFDNTLGYLIYDDRALPEESRDRLTQRLKSTFDPARADLFPLEETLIQDLAKLLGPDFRGAIVEIGHSDWSHDSRVTTMLIDLPRAGKVFNLSPN